MFKVKKPYDRFMVEITHSDNTIVNDKVAGLYFLRLNKCFGVKNMELSRLGHNTWLMRRKGDIKIKRETPKYTIFF